MTAKASSSATFAIAGDLPVHRLDYGAMRITGDGVWGEPRDHDAVAACAGVEHLEENLAATELVLSDDELRELDGLAESGQA